MQLNISFAPKLARDLPPMISVTQSFNRHHPVRENKLSPLRILFLAFAGATALCGCDSGVQWRDGKYEVSWIDTSENRSLYLSLEGGGGIGRVGPTVVAVGSSEEYIVVKQKSLGSGAFSYYFIDRKKDDPSFNGNEIAEGPFTSLEFDALKQGKHLPEFSETFGD